MIPSTFVNGEQAYLLNVSAGTYVAVAALYSVDSESVNMGSASTNVGSNASVGVNLDMFGGEDTYRNYFSKDLIEQTMTTVGSREFACMGRFVTDQSTFGDADEHQRYFLKVLEGKDDAGSFVGDLFSSDHARCLSLHEAQKDESADKEFCKRAMNDLQDTAWVVMIGGHMAE